MYEFNPSRRSLARDNSPVSPYTPASMAKSSKRQSVNSFAISGFLVADACVYHNGTVRFTLVHKYGGIRRTPDLRTDIVAFPFNGSQKISIPLSLLRKGRNVIVKGFRQPNSRVDSAGRKHDEINCVALEIIDNN